MHIEDMGIFNLEYAKVILLSSSALFSELGSKSQMTHHRPKKTKNGVCVGGGGIRLIVGFQPLMVIPPTGSWIQ